MLSNTKIEIDFVEYYKHRIVSYRMHATIVPFITYVPMQKSMCLAYVVSDVYTG